jgi:oxygen-independent coproporphyrinogen-3 oxidase
MARAETMFLGLRLLIDGVRVNSPSEGCEPSEGFQRQIGDLVQAGLLEVDDRRVRLTRRGRLLSNQVFVRFME